MSKDKNIKNNVLTIKSKNSNNSINNLEWVSIKKDGMKYIVRAEERIIKSEVVSDKPRDIVASKDAYITKVISSKGNVLVRQGEYVKKGTVLISGKITLYEDVILNNNLLFQKDITLELLEKVMNENSGLVCLIV